MSDSITEQIAQKIVSRLEQQTEANGYNVELSAVTRRTRDGRYIQSDGTLLTTITDKFAVVLQGDNKPDESGAGAAKRSRVLTVYVDLYSIPSDKNVTVSVDSEVNDLVGSTMKALSTSEDASDWGRMGGLAINSWFGDVTWYTPSSGTESGALIEVNVQYRTPETDPYTVA